MLKLLGGAKPVRLNPYAPIKGGTEVNVTVDGVAVVARVDAKGVYSYLPVNGVDYYVSAALEDGGAYTAEDVVVAPKAKKEVDPNAPKRTRKPKAVAAVAEAESEDELVEQAA
jgi:hypothetical protein